MVFKSSKKKGKEKKKVVLIWLSEGSVDIGGLARKINTSIFVGHSWGIKFIYFVYFLFVWLKVEG